MLEEQKTILEDMQSLGIDFTGLESGAKEEEVDQTEEEELQQTLKRLEMEREETECAIVEKKKEQEVCEIEIQRQWAQYNVATTERYYRYKAYAAATARATEQERQIYKFKTRSIYLDMFQIVVDENVGIINGLQMGKGNGSAIDWQEVNTAWGIVVLLVQTICKARQYTSTQYQLHFDGAQSGIYVGTGVDKVLYELHGAGDSQLGRLFFNRKFDQGMVAFLAMLNEFAQRVIPRPNSFPYAIQGHMVGKESIRTHFSSDENWSKGYRNLLANLQWLLKWNCAEDIGA